MTEFINSATNENNDSSTLPLVLYGNIKAVKYGRRSFEGRTNIGSRPKNEDRILICPSLFSDRVVSVCAVFDGTVGDQASQYLQQNFISHLISSENLKILNSLRLTSEEHNWKESFAPAVRATLSEAFLSTDASLLSICAENKWHFTSSTGIVSFCWENILAIAHVGDSRACIARKSDVGFTAEWLTVDHKPDVPTERQRIESSGGLVVYLHGNKPYIRGGDFLARLATGESPKQLNYSRAFGGKDLKNFGLIAEPDISIFEITSDDLVVILASDGIWDLLHPTVACEIALEARRCNRSASEDIEHVAMDKMRSLGSGDNISVIVIFLDEA